MVEDTPNDLVHDIAAEAVFGAHPLGRPVIGRADVISSVSRRALAGYHGRAYQGDKIVLAAAGNVRHDELVALLERTEERTLGQSEPCRPQACACERDAGRPLPAEGHRAVPRLPQRSGNLPPRRAPLRRVADGRDHRRLGVVAPLPGDPREARDGVLGLQLLVAVRRRGTDRRLRGNARGQSRRVPRDRRRGALGHRVGQRARRRARTREGEPQGPDPALARVDLGADDAAREVDDHGHAAPDARGDREASRGGHGERGRGARRRAPCAGRGCRSPGSAPTRAASPRRSSA